MAAQQMQMSPQQQNAMVRQLILRGGVLGSILLSARPWTCGSNSIRSCQARVGPGSVITIQLRNVGLVKRLVLEFSATITAGATSVQTLTPLGLANLISNITFIDLGNNTRINSTGWHLNAISSRQAPPRVLRQPTPSTRPTATATTTTASCSRRRRSPPTPRRRSSSCSKSRSSKTTTICAARFSPT